MHMQRLAALALALAVSTSPALAKSRIQTHDVRAIEAQGCPDGSFSVVTSPDGSALSVLFDNFAVNGTEANGGFARMTCAMEIPLRLPEGYSLGVYQMDYRGFAHLAEKQRAELRVDYGTGRGNRGRQFHRDVKGSYEGDFSFNERLKGGILKRVGCGEDAVLNFRATLTLVSKRGAREGTMALDSADGAPVGGLTFGLDLRKCKG
jgi:hypothetical protein